MKYPLENGTQNTIKGVNLASKMRPNGDDNEMSLKGSWKHKEMR